jgi:urease accessory protein
MPRGTGITTAKIMTMAITTTMRTATAMTDDGLYRMMAWLSPSFPVGGFSYSHGIEAAVEAGLVADRESLRGYIAAAIAHGAGRSDAMLFAAVWRAVAAGDEPAFLWAAVRAAAMRGTAELALECLSQGTAFLATVRSSWPDPELQRWIDALGEQDCKAAYPVAVALCAAVSEVPMQQALRAYLQAFAASLITAGVKLVPLGQTDGQRIVAGLELPIRGAADRAIATPLDDLGSAAPMIDLLSMRHETQYTRLFRS